MSAKALRDVSQTLVELLRLKLGDLKPKPVIGAMSPVEANKLKGTRLSVFLYSVVPTAELRNAPPRRIDAARTRQPLSLDLYYLITAFPGEASQDEGTEDNNLQAHWLLGAAMQVLYEHGTLYGSHLKGHLPRDEELHVSFQPITVEDMTRVWGVFPECGLLPSVSYLVTPVNIDATPVADNARVTQADVEMDHIAPAP